MTGAGGVANRKTLRPLLRVYILNDAVDAFYEPRPAPARHRRANQMRKGCVW